MIKLTDEHIIKTSTSSKGNQLKWLIDNKWYKADFLGYEGLSEYVISHLLKKSNASKFVVSYNLEKIIYHTKILNGCASKNFVMPNSQIITLYKLFMLFLQQDIYKECESPLLDEKECIKYVVENVKKITGLQNFDKYLTLLFEIDAFFFNEDRHFNNIAVGYNLTTKKFEYCPIFDFGASLFSDMSISYDINDSVESCMHKVNAKPISPSFEDQVRAARELYGKQLEIYFDEYDVDEQISIVRDIHMYSEKVLNRVSETIKMQINTERHEE